MDKIFEAVSYPTKKKISPKRWAVILIGGSRTYSFARESFLKHVVHAPAHPMDVFAAVPFFDRNCTLDAFSLNLLQSDSKAMMVNTDGHKVGIGHLQPKKQTADRFLHQQKAMEFLVAYAHNNSEKYDYILYSRPDTIYSQTLNISKIEAEIDRIGDNALLAPHCCAYGALCDRFNAGTFSGMKRMFLGSEKWANHTPGHMVWEVAFYSRANFTGMQAFDLPGTYSFGLLRLNSLRRACFKSPLTEKWTDTICFKGFPKVYIYDAHIKEPLGGCSMLASPKCKGLV